MAFPFELSVDLTTLAILALVAFIAGFIDAIAGGGGLLTIPALLTAGLPPHLALGTNKLSSTFGSAAASYTFYRRKLFDPSQWRNALIGTAVGALLGAALAQWLPSEWLNQLLPAVVFGCGLYLLFGKTPDAPLLAEAPIAKGRQWPQS
ncbi:MAG TPA: TSUP family transporter, partial [Pseudomonas sp.]|nr:TSUP family transporter [Pseudomonas sp.]